MKVELHPKIWLGKNIDKSFNGICQNLGAFLRCLESEKEVPNLNELVENYLNNFLSIKESDRCLVYAMCWIYVNCVSGNDLEYIENMQQKLQKFQGINDVCCMGSLIGKCYGMVTKDFDIEDVILVMDAYNKNKFKKNRLKIPASIENKIYLTIAYSYGDDYIEEKQKWLKKAYKNAVNDKELQCEILEMLKEINN